MTKIARIRLFGIQSGSFVAILSYIFLQIQKINKFKITTKILISIKMTAYFCRSFKIENSVTFHFWKLFGSTFFAIEIYVEQGKLINS